MQYSLDLPVGLSLISDSIVRKSVPVYTLEYVELMETLINHFEKNPNPMVVSVRNFQCDFKPLLYNMYYYSYDMDRLGMLSKEDQNIIDDYFFNRKPSTNNDKLVNFLNKAEHEGKYWDIHSGNIMIDSKGNYRFIDLEGFISDNEYKNNWIRNLNQTLSIPMVPSAYQTAV